MRTLYRILGIEKDASPRDIKRAFRAIARDNHPDYAHQRGWSAAEAKKRAAVYREATAANEILSKVNKRAAYDRELDAIRWSFMARQRARRRPRQSARPDLDPQPFDGINVEDVASMVTEQANQQRQLRIEAGRDEYQTRKQAFRDAVEKMTQDLMAEVMLAQMDALGL